MVSIHPVVVQQDRTGIARQAADLDTLASTAETSGAPRTPPARMASRPTAELRTYLRDPDPARPRPCGPSLDAPCYLCRSAHNEGKATFPDSAFSVIRGPRWQGPNTTYRVAPSRLIGMQSLAIIPMEPSEAKRSAAGFRGRFGRYNRHGRTFGQQPVAAWGAIKAEVERRIAHQQESAPSGTGEPTRKGGEQDRPGQSTGGAMPTHPGVATQARRPFIGFDLEVSDYMRLKPELLSRFPGKFVVIVGDEVEGPVETFREALRAGYRRFGLGPLFVKQILAVEPVVEVTRDIMPCRS